MRTISLHTHGHHPTLTHVDGYPVPDGMRYTRDVFTIGPSQRIDLLLRTTPDNYYASGPGVWLMHDHNEIAVTNQGISPGGDLTAIVYDSFIGPDGLPKVATSLDRFFDPEYYRGKVPVFDPAIFHSTAADYEQRWRTETVVSHAHGHGEEHHMHDDSGVPHTQQQAPAAAHVHQRAHMLEEHRPVARSCATPRGLRRIRIQAGTEFAAEGEVFGFAPRQIHLGRCEEVEVVLENKDAIRHAMMIPGLNPMFMLEFQGPGVQTGRFVTPDEDITLPFHCHVPTHEKMGMTGVFIVGKGGQPRVERAVDTGNLFEGVGRVIAVDPRQRTIVVDHEEIPGFMAAMIMGYPVQPGGLLRGIKVGDHIRFTIDASRQAIIKIKRIGP